VTDCEGVHYFKDTDGEEYIYTDLEPANGHLWFPCFDQPDLKAPYRLLVLTHEDWRIIATCAQKGPIHSTFTEEAIKDFGLDAQTV
jgi:aminopeptidase N